MKNRNGGALPGGLNNWCDVAENLVPGDMIDISSGRDHNDKYVLYQRIVMVLCNIPWPRDGCSYPNGLVKFMVLSCVDCPAIVGHIFSRQWLYHPHDETLIIHKGDVK